MKKADGWSMGQGEQKKKALEEKLRRRAYTAAFEAAQQRKEKPWQSWDEAFSERLAKQPFITEEERKPFAPSGAGAQNAFYTGEKQPWPGLGEAWPGQARRAERTPWAALPENLPDGAGAMLLAGQRRSMAQAAPGGEPPAGPEQGAPGFALEGVDPAYRDAVYAGQALAQERAQAEGVGAAYTKYVRPLLERAALGLSTILPAFPSVPGSEPGTGLAQAIETSNANYERNKTHDISGRPVHGQGVDAAGEFAYGNSQMKDSGCGVIGTYNALYLLGKDPSLAEVGRRYEISGAMAGGGAWGTNPYGAPQVLKQYGVQYEEYTDPDALEREAGEGDVMIVSIWNRKGTIFEGYHTFAVQKVNGELMVYNRFNNSAESTEKKTMGEVIENGQFIVGYRVQNAK